MTLSDQSGKRASVTRSMLAVVTAFILASSAAVHAQDDAADSAFYNGVTAYRAYRYEEAAQWFLQAAEAGDAEAQFLLGRMHYDGNSLSVDNVTAYMWFDIAAENGLPVGARYREGIAERMSEAEIGLAKQRAETWRVAHPRAQ
jgi:TPR repeat protein